MYRHDYTSNMVIVLNSYSHSNQTIHAMHAYDTGYGIVKPAHSYTTTTLDCKINIDNVCMHKFS